MREYLKESILDYVIIVVVQDSKKDFNRGALLNVGYLQACKLECDYVVFHDVDMLPVNIDYSEVKEPTQVVCTVVGKSKDEKIPYDYSGGVVLFPISDLERINGFSNKYWGWGFEDNDLLLRCKEEGISLNDMVFTQPDTYGTAIKFDGKYSYIEINNPFSFKRDVIFYVDFIVDDLTVNLRDSKDECSIFSIPGLDITLAYDSFGTYKFECFDNYEDVYSIHTEKLPKMHCKVCIYYNHLQNSIQMYLNGNMVGERVLIPKRKINVASNKLYLGSGNPNRRTRKKMLDGKIFTFVAAEGHMEEGMLESFVKGDVDNIIVTDTRIFIDSRKDLKYVNVDGILELDSIENKATKEVIYPNLCTVEMVPKNEQYVEKVLFKQNGMIRELPHEKNGTVDGYWKSWATRINQDRYQQCVKNGTGKEKDGVSTVRTLFNWTVKNIEKDLVTVNTETR